MKNKALPFLFLVAISLFSCSDKRIGIYQGQSTSSAFKRIRNLNVTYRKKKDFTFFRYEDRNYVIQQEQDYQHIKKIRDYEPVVPSLSEFDDLKRGMDLFQVIEKFGLPCASSSGYQDTCLGFSTKEGVVKLIPFYSDMSHIGKTC